MKIEELNKWCKNSWYQFEIELNISVRLPLNIIAMNHASYYAINDKISLKESMKNTLELFHEDNFEIEDWAKNNIHWQTVKDFVGLKQESTMQSLYDFLCDIEKTKEMLEHKMQENWCNPKNVKIITE